MRERVTIALSFKIKDTMFVGPDEFIDVFEYIQGRLISNPGYELKNREKEKKKVEELLNENESIRENAWKFISFIFSNKTCKNGRFAIVPFKQITSKNAVKRFKEIDIKGEYLISNFQLKYHLENPFKKKEEGFSEEYKERMRSKHLNTTRGFILCQSFEGFLFDKEFCKRCRYHYICSNEENCN